jgi:integration host factor subunit alpha
MNLTKESLALLLQQTIGLAKVEAADLVRHFFDQISIALEHGETVKLYGFGVFSLRDKRARPGRNPTTREPFPISARRIVVFRPSPLLSKVVQEKTTARTGGSSLALALAQG